VPAGGDVVHTGAQLDAFGHVQLKGVGELLERGLLERVEDLQTRVTVLGHLLRGGTPTAYDRVLATRSGLSAVTAIAEGRFGTMAALRGTDVVQVPLSEATGELKTVGDPRLEELRWVSG
jgi:6-phosphofructokinase 1